jgi:DNA modification methylase
VTDIRHGDCRELMRAMEPDSVDAIVTDPPYGLEFMGKEWDKLGDGRKHHLQPKMEQSGAGGFKYGAPKKNPRCRRCEKLQWGRDVSTCKCEAPDWDTRTSERARDMQTFHESWAREALRVLKPGGHLVAFGGTRTYHRLTCALEDAGFEIRDSLMWLYGSGFPKSLDVSKAIDKVKDWSLVERLAVEIKRAREASGLTLAQVGAATLAATDGRHGAWYHRGGHMFFETGRSLPTREEWPALFKVLPIAAEFADVYEAAEREVIGTRIVSDIRNGHGRALGGSMFAGEKTGTIEHATTAPATDAARAWEGWGTALKPAFEPIVLARKPLAGTVAANVQAHGTGAINVDGCRIGTDLMAKARSVGGKKSDNGAMAGHNTNREPDGHRMGRWPANVLLDEEAAAILDEQSGITKDGVAVEPKGGPKTTSTYLKTDSLGRSLGFGGKGGASRFFYTAKASSGERHGQGKNEHPTVKPVDLMRWLCRLVTPKGGTILDPFTGSGSTGVAALAEGFRFVGMEQDAKSVETARRRVMGRLFAGG